MVTLIWHLCPEFQEFLCQQFWGLEMLCRTCKCYCPLSSWSYSLTENFVFYTKSQIFSFLLVSKVCSLQRLEPRWRSKMPLPPLLVRIMHKSRLRYFGKADKKIEYPYQVRKISLYLYCFSTSFCNRENRFSLNKSSIFYGFAGEIYMCFCHFKYFANINYIF